MNLFTQFKVYCLLMAFLGTHFFSFSQTSKNLLRVTKQLYMIGGLGGNVSFLVTKEGVLVVDAGTLPRDAIEIQRHVKNVTNQPIKYLVLTHYHYDHSFGLCGFDDKVVVIAHENAANNLKKFGPSSKDYFCNQFLKPRMEKSKLLADSLKNEGDTSWVKMDSVYKSQNADYEQCKLVEICTPDSLFKEQLSIYLANDTIDLIYPGPTHTSGNILVVFRNQNAVATGDIFFNQMMPYIDFEAGSNTLNWALQARKLAAKDYRYIIPGHGPLAGGKKILQQSNYLSDLRSEISNLIKMGKKPEEIKGAIKMEKYSHYDLQYMLPVEVDAVYKELTTVE